jgi:hypothetical protein
MNSHHTDSIASTVQVLVAAWFLVAAGAILADPASPYTQRPVPAAVAQNAQATKVAVAPKMRATITVSASRVSPGTVTTYSL